jgi:hypothetical protein
MANEYDPDETLAISCRPVNKTTAKTICYDLYTRVLKRFVVSSMPPPMIQAKKEAKNFYILMPDKDVKRLKKGLLLFKSATNYRNEVQEVDLSGVNWGDVTTSRREIDSAKIPSVCRLAKEKLEQNPNCKVMIYCNYRRDMKTAAYLLAKYSPLIMDGSTSEKQRSAVISSFQKDSNEYRVIISNPKVGGIGIDLDDKFGNHPRFMYVLPSYFFTDQYQATGRGHRIGTKSKFTVYFIYSRAFPYETGILNSMATKSQVTRNMVTREQRDITFPGEYDEVLELTPEEIENGVQMDLSRSMEEAKPEPEPEPDNRPYSESRHRLEQLENNYEKSDLEWDKYHAYNMFLEMVDQKHKEEDAVKEVCTVMNENVYTRLNRDLQNLAYKTDIDQQTEEEMIQFIEGFTM